MRESSYYLSKEMGVSALYHKITYMIEFPRKKNDVNSSQVILIKSTHVPVCVLDGIKYCYLTKLLSILELFKVSIYFQMGVI